MRFVVVAGLVFVCLFVLVLFLSGLFPLYARCLSLGFSYQGLAPDASRDGGVPAWSVVASCSGVENDVYVAVFFIALGVALVSGVFVLRRDDEDVLFEDEVVEGLFPRR